MKRPKYMVVNEHRASFPYAMIAIEGDEVIVGKEDPEMHGWYRCKDKNDVEDGLLRPTSPSKMAREFSPKIVTQ